MPEIDDKLLDRFQRACPLAHKALAGRRYLLPNKYQDSYSDQNMGIQRRQLILLSWALGLVKDSLPERAELICLLQAMRCGLPVIFLDPGLAEALRDTDLPSDLSISDIGFSWASVRLMVPKGLCLSADGRSGQVQYLDVAFCGQDETVNLSSELASDLGNGLPKLGGNRALDNRLANGFIHPEGDQLYACALSYRREGNISAPDSAASFQTAAWSIQWETRLLQEVVQAGNKADLDHGKDPLVPDLGQIRSLVFNTLIVLSVYRSPVILEEPAIVRNLKLEGSHLRPELVRGRFLSELLRPRTIRGDWSKQQRQS
jgi:hypothetical protein